jgi:hypothetical protein
LTESNSRNYIDQLAAEWGPPYYVGTKEELPTPADSLYHWGFIESTAEGYLWVPETKEWVLSNRPATPMLNGKIRPLKLQEVKSFGYGWYMHLDFDHQKTFHGLFGRPHGGWFYEWTEQGWRDESGCLDCGPFKEKDLFIGPIAMDEFI